MPSSSSASRWKPQAGIDVVDEQGAAFRSIGQDDVRDQMSIRGRGLDPPEHIVGDFQPAQGVCLVLLLNLVPWLDAVDQVMHDPH